MDLRYLPNPLVGLVAFERYVQVSSFYRSLVNLYFLKCFLFNTHVSHSYVEIGRMRSLYTLINRYSHSHDATYPSIDFPVASNSSSIIIPKRVFFKQPLCTKN